MATAIASLPGPALFDLLDISGDLQLDADEIYTVRGWMITQHNIIDALEKSDVTQAQLFDFLEQAMAQQEEVEAASPAGIVPVIAIQNPDVPPVVLTTVNGFLKDYAHAVPYVRTYFRERIAALREQAIPRDQYAVIQAFSRGVDEQAGWVTGDFARVEIADGARGIGFHEFLWAQGFHRFGEALPAQSVLSTKESTGAHAVKDRVAATLDAKFTVPGVQQSLDLLASSPTGALILLQLTASGSGRAVRFAMMSAAELASYGGNAAALYDSGTNTVKIRPEGFDNDDVIRTSAPILGHELFHALLSTQQADKPKTVSEEEMAANLAWLISAQLGIRTPKISCGNIYSDAVRWQAIWNAYSPYTYAYDATFAAVTEREASLDLGIWHDYIERQTEVVLDAGYLSMR